MPDAISTPSAPHTLVVGCGLAGLLAAIFTARQGHAVRLLYRGQGALGLGGGTIDVLGALPGQTCALKSPLDGLAALPEEHPYRLAGEAALTASLHAFAALTAELGFPHTFRTDEAGRPLNTPVFTAAGTAKPSCLVPPSMTMAGLAPGTSGDILIIGFAGLKDVYPRLMAQGFARLRSLADRPLIPLTLRCPAALCPDHFAPHARLRDLSTLDLARYMDTPEGLHWLTERLRAAHPLTPDTTILLPPILGTAPSDRIHAALEAALGCHVHEVLTPPPSVSGLRLRTALFAELARLNVSLTANATVTGYEAEGDRCQALLTSMGGRTLRWPAERFIMATGGIYGEGITVRPDSVVDAVFPQAALFPDLTPRSPDWSQPEAYPGPDAPGHAFARLGARVNGRFQPLDAQGEPLFSNLFTVGRAIGGYDHAAEKSGNGVALVTGFEVAEHNLVQQERRAS